MLDTILYVIHFIIENTLTKVCDSPYAFIPHVTLRNQNSIKKPKRTEQSIVKEEVERN